MPGTPRPVLSGSLLTPRHWPSWLGLGALYLIARLPHRLLMGLGRALGIIVQHFPSPRRHIAETNITLCFPELNGKARAALIKDHLRDIGLMMVEFTLGWLGSKRAIERIPVHIEGMEHLEAARNQGQGVLLVGGHFSHLELCARLLAQRTRIAGMYRRMDGAVFDWTVLRARLNYADAMFEKNDIRGAVKYLRARGTLWYAPDQDLRGKNQIFAPFFGIPAATITATHHLARLGKAVVIPFCHHRLPRHNGYRLRLGAPLTHLPGPDAREDTARINACIEQMVRAAPEQYLWIHRRFKTRPEGSATVYRQIQGKNLRSEL